MKSLRWMAGAVPLVLAGAGLIPLIAQNANAQNAKPQKKSAQSALTFQVNASFRYHDEDGSSSPGDSLDAKVLVQGQKARLETKVGGRPLVMIFAPPSLYRLLPASKTGTRLSLNEVSKNPGLAGFNPQPWLRNPQQIRTSLRQQGAKLSGNATLNGVPVEVWTAQKFMGNSGQVKAWLRRADALPLRLEVKSKALTATATWRNYQRVPVVASAQFSPPAGYRIRDRKADE